MAEKEVKKKKRSKKEKSTMDKVTDIFIVCIIVAAAVFIGLLVWQNYKDKKDKEEKVKQATEKLKQYNEEAAKDAEPTPLPDGVVRYDNNISSGETNDTYFYILLNYNDNTYEERVSAASLDDQLDEGTFTEADGKIKTISTKYDNSKETYIIDGDYIIPKSAIFKGEIPEDETFDAEVYLDSKDYLTTIKFFEGGTFNESKQAKTEDIEDSSRGGSYTKKDLFIERVDNEGEILVDLYIYKNQVANAYYKKTDS